MINPETTETITELPCLVTKGRYKVFSEVWWIPRSGELTKSLTKARMKRQRRAGHTWTQVQQEHHTALNWWQQQQQL